jgi:hypothetical protein
MVHTRTFEDPILSILEESAKPHVAMPHLHYLAR